MVWFFLTLGSSLLWSVNNHLDKFLAERYYRGGTLPGTLMFLTATLGAIMSVVIFVLHPAALHVRAASIAILLVVGVIDFVYIFPYILALLRDEASRVAPLFQIGPVFSYLLAMLFLGEHLTLREVIAGLIITLGAIGINLDIDNGFHLKRSVLLLMLLSTGLFSLETFLFKLGARDYGYWSGAAYQYLGAALTGLVLAVVNSRYRRDFGAVFRAHRRSVLTLSVAADALSATARVMLNSATLLAPLALVAFVSNIQPFFVIALGVLLTVFAPHIGTEAIARRHLGQKVLCTSVIVVGTCVLLIG